MNHTTTPSNVRPFIGPPPGDYTQDQVKDMPYWTVITPGEGPHPWFWSVHETKEEARQAWRHAHPPSKAFGPNGKDAGFWA